MEWEAEEKQGVFVVDVVTGKHVGASLGMFAI